jgi:hypothetical protein
MERGQRLPLTLCRERGPCKSGAASQSSHLLPLVPSPVALEHARRGAEALGRRLFLLELRGPHVFPSALGREGNLGPRPAGGKPT